MPRSPNATCKQLRGQSQAGSVAGSGAAIPAGPMLQRRDSRSLQRGQARLLQQPQCCRARLQTPKPGIKAILLFQSQRGRNPLSYGTCAASVPPWGSDRALSSLEVDVLRLVASPSIYREAPPKRWVQTVPGLIPPSRFAQERG